MEAVKRRLACLLRRWADRLDPAPPFQSGGWVTSPQPLVGSAGWSWNTGLGGSTPIPPQSDPPSLTVVR